MASGDTKTESLLDILANGTRADIPSDTCCNTKTQDYILGAINRVISIEEEVERLENNPDVADIVATYADLQSYDTSTLTDKDIIRVLNDETHDGKSTYYRYSTQSGAFTFVGEINPVVDDALSSTSENPVQNKVIYAAIGDIESILNTINSGTGV